MRVLTFLYILVTSLMLSSCSKDNATPPAPTSPSSLTDPRNGQVYKIVTIGTQTWMAQNLNYETGSSWCYNNDSANCATYGRLYDWQTAKGACPSGWHLPTDAEWTTLSTFLGGESIAGGKMKSVSGWDSPNTGATNQSGFSGLPGGYRVNSGVFIDLGKSGSWWSANESGSNSAWKLGLFSFGSETFRYNNVNKEQGYSVRCIKD